MKLYEEIEGNIKYEVYHDEDDFYHTFESRYAIDFESEKDKEEYKQKFINNEIYAFGVKQFDLCPTCGNFEQKDSLWGIHATTVYEAIRLYKEARGTLLLG